MKKSQLKQLIGSTIREIITEYASDAEEYERWLQTQYGHADRAKKTKKSPSHAGKETENEKLLNMKIKNPDTGEDIKLKSALSYKKDTQVYKAAKTAHDKAVDIIADKPKKKTAKKKAAPVKKKGEPERFAPTQKDKDRYAAYLKDKEERHARGEKEDWEKSDEERIQDREAEKRAEKERQEAEKEKAKKDLHGNDWHDSKAEKLSDFGADGKLFRGKGESYADMMKKSHSEIDKGNITKDTLPSVKLPSGGTSNIRKQADFARKEYDRVVDKAWNKDKEATRDSLINRIYDVNDSPESKELMKKIKSGDADWHDKQKLKDMTRTGLEDIEFMKNKVGEKNLMHHMKRIKKEREYEKKSGIGKFFSKLGLNEEDVKNLPKLKDLIKR